MIGRLYDYFGVIGVGSGVCWLAALLFVVIAVPLRRRTMPLWIAFGFGVLGLCAARINTALVDRIQIDWEAEAEIMRKAKAEAAQKEADLLKTQAAKVQFVEDSPDDRLDIGGVKDPENRYEQAMEDAQKSPEYFYRQQGKKQRTRKTPGAATDGKEGEGEKVEKRESFSDQVDEGEKPEGRKMLQAELKVVHHYDKVNLNGARVAFYLTLILVILDYLFQFNNLARGMYPLPIAGMLTDALSRKTHSVMFRPGAVEAAVAFIEAAVRRGENFLLFADRDPWPDGELARTPFDCFHVRKRSLAATADALDEQFLFESLWFGRSCFVVEDDTGANALPLVDTLVQFLETRRMARASTRRTVNIVWSYRMALPLSVVSELRMLCEEENCRLVLVEPEEAAEEAAALVEKCVAVNMPSPSRLFLKIDRLLAILGHWCLVPLGRGCAGFARQSCFFYRSVIVALIREERPRNLLPMPPPDSNQR